MSQKKQEVIGGWDLCGVGDDAVAEWRSPPTRYLWVDDGIVYMEDMYHCFKVPHDVLRRFVERMNGIDLSADQTSGNC